MYPNLLGHYFLSASCAICNIFFVGLLFSEFRFGWETNIHCIPRGASEKSAFQTFMVVLRKEKLGTVKTVISSSDYPALDCNEKQVRNLALLGEYHMGSGRPRNLMPFKEVPSILTCFGCPYRLKL